MAAICSKKHMFSYALGANIARALVLLLATFFIPKYFGTDIKQYGMQQIFVFYIGYIGLCHLGICDGLYLREGGTAYYELDNGKYSMQFRILFALLLAEAIVILLGFRLIGKIEYAFIVYFISINLVIQNLCTYFDYILQATGEIRSFALAHIGGNVLYSFLILLLFIFKTVDYKYLIEVYTISQLFILGIDIAKCQNIVFCKPCKLSLGINETLTNIFVGSQLLIANIAANLINGVVRFGVQQNWSLEIYGQISLTISISNILLLFISAISMVLYPILRRAENERYSEIYRQLRSLLMFLLFGGMLFYYPFMCIVTAWLPQYTLGLRYMTLLFPICCYSAKMSMLILTYMKVLRLERKILLVNIVTVAVSVLSTIFTCFIFKNLTIAMISMLLNQIFRCIFAEWILCHYIKYKPNRDMIIEIMMTLIFILGSWKIGGIVGGIFYGGAYGAYVFFCKDELTNNIKNLIFNGKQG